MAGTPQRGVVLTQARELVRLARQHGYHRDKLIQNIEACRGPLWPTRGADKVGPMGAMDR